MKKILIWLLLCLIWGTTWIFIKIGLDDLPPIAFAASQVFAGGHNSLLCNSHSKDPAAENRKRMATHRPDRRAAILDKLQHGVLERGVYHVGTRGGLAGDDHRLWTCPGVDIPTERTHHKAQDHRRSRSESSGSP